MAYTTTSYTDGSTTLTIKKGSKTVVADLSGFEADRNPDQRIEYGINNADDCVKGALGDYAEYHGIVESHPYAVEAWGDSWIVADAAGNDLLKVTAQARSPGLRCCRRSRRRSRPTWQRQRASRTAWWARPTGSRPCPPTSSGAGRLALRDDPARRPGRPELRGPGQRVEGRPEVR